MKNDNAKLKMGKFSSVKSDLAFPTSYTLHPTPSSRGFVLPFSVLLAGILLSIGLAIFSITLKELILSSVGRDSQIAFFAADAGAECALYWDLRHPNFSTSIFDTYTNLEAFTVPTDGMVAYWNLDEGSGTTAADSSGNGNTGTLTNSPTWTTGQISNAVSFDGGNDYIRVPDNTNLDGFAQASFTAWVKLNALADGTPHAILDKRTDFVTDHAYSMGLNYGAPAPCTNELEFEVGSAGGGGNSGVSYVCVDKDVVTWVGQWHHVAFVYDSAATPNYRISIDGVQRTLLRSDNRNATLNNSIRDVTIGIANNAGAGPFNGLIDDVRIYNRALSVAEISALYSYIGLTGGTGAHGAVPQNSNTQCGDSDITNPITGWNSGTGPDAGGWYTEAIETGATTVFDMSFGNGTCALVKVIKDNGTTRIDSRGYNTCAEGNSRRVERGLRVRY